MVIVDLSEDPKFEPREIIGIDLGIVNIVTTSDGQQFSGEQCTEIRKKYSIIRSKLQSVNTWNAKKHLKKISGRERRFKRYVNHCISKQIVAHAKDTLSGIAIENLTGIRERVTGYKELRATIGKWAFFEIASFIQYKAGMGGVSV
jgi:IS605 OrfB family transposase